MRVVIQKVKEASVRVGEDTISEISEGLLCLVGIRDTDNKEDIAYATRKVLNGRLFPNEEKERPWDLSVKEKELEVLCVSQFTLFCNFKGNKPDYHLAMPPREAQEVYENFLTSLRSTYREDKIKDGRFGAMMNVSLVNDGPVTVIVDTKQRTTMTRSLIMTRKPGVRQNTRRIRYQNFKRFTLKCCSLGFL